MAFQEQASSQNQKNWQKYVLALMPSIIIYAYRSWFRYYELILFCFLSILFLSIVIIIIINVLLSKRILDIGLCVLTVAISILAPNPIPEQVHLALHRSEYETIIEKARNHQLGHEGVCQFAYVLPEKYSNLASTKYKCIFVKYEPALVVVFEPLFPRILLVYAETPEAVKEYISCGGSDGVGYHELEENWYRCFQDWN